MMIGIIPWFYVSENVMGTVQSLLEYSFLIKNFSFRPGIIPLINILTNSLIHPIWSYKMLPEKFYFSMKLNPVFYLVEGYRNTFTAFYRCALEWNNDD